MVEQFRISADKLIEQSKNRKIIPLSITADISLGGGVPLGCTVLIGGLFKSGKTTISMQYGANAQNLYGSKIFFYPIEGRLTSKIFDQIKNVKTDEDNFIVVMPPPIYDSKNKEEIIGYQKWTSPEWWTAIGNNIKDNPFSIHIVDSISAMASAGEASEDVGKQERGSLQKDQSQFTRKFGDLVVANRCTVFLIAQIQANTSGYGHPTQIKAGNSIKHQADVILEIMKTEKWKVEKEGMPPVGHDICVKCTESALGPPHVEFKVPLRYGVGIDTLKDLISSASNFDLIKVSGSWYNLPFKETKDGKIEYTTDEKLFVKTQGENKTYQWFLIRPEAQKILEQKVKEIIFGETN